MANSSPILQPKSTFDSFLFAPVGNDDKGMAVSVLSALARLDVDPWQEAAKLACLPKQAARGELATAIAKLPDVPQAHIDPLRIADRLIALLPSPRQQPSAASAARLGTGSAIDLRSSKFIIVLVLLLALAFVSQVFTASQQSIPPADNMQTGTSSTTQAPTRTPDTTRR
jgi:hypothetical protein